MKCVVWFLRRDFISVRKGHCNPQNIKNLGLMFGDDTIFAIFNVKHPNLILKFNFRNFRTLKTLLKTVNAEIYLLIIEEIF